MRAKIVKYSRKVNNYSLLPLDGGTAEVDINEVIELSNVDWEEFKDNMLDSYYWLENTDGAVLVKNIDGEGQVVVDTEGYDYARYTARVLEIL